MPRDELPMRRFSVNTKVNYVLQNQKEVHLTVTYGFEDGKLREAFCASFKEGTDMQFLAMDASIILSRLLQCKDDLSEIVKSLGSPVSMIGAIARKGLELELEYARKALEQEK